MSLTEKTPDVSDNTLVIADGCQPPPWVGVCLHWDRVEVPPGHHSAPALVSRSMDSLRQEYLAWMHQIGELVLGGKSEPHL